jgi:acyl-coenzyme A thioesterase PaaI-like protein
MFRVGQRSFLTRRSLGEKTVAVLQKYLGGVETGLDTTSCTGIVEYGERTARVGTISQGWLSGALERSKSTFARHMADEGEHNGQWSLLQQKGYDINPCKSKLHPAVKAEGLEPEDGEEVCVQDAYTPDSTCFGCGPSAPDGLKLQSYRIENGLEARVSIDPKFCAFPGIINGGIVATLFDCHGNWTAAVTLMDKGCLPKPPLTTVAEILIRYEEPTPPNEDLLLRSRVVDVEETGGVGSKATVHVELALLQRMHMGEGGEVTIATGTGIFKKLGALRAL